MVSTKAFQEVPRTVKDWERARKAAGLQRSSINSFLGMHSGSEMTQGQYLLMKVLYPKRRPITSFNPATYSLTQDLQAATALLNASSQSQELGWHMYQKPGIRVEVWGEIQLNVFTSARVGEYIESTCRAGSGRGLYFQVSALSG